MQFVLYLTLVEVALGMALIQCFIPSSALGPGFGKTISASIFFCLLFPTLGIGQLMPRSSPLLPIVLPSTVALALWFAYFTALNYERPTLQRAFAIGGMFCQWTALLMVCLHLAHFFYSPGFSPGFDPASGALLGFGPSIKALFLSLSLGLTASALLLGAVTMGMLIGHWYLVIPGLAIEWLKGACVAFSAAILLKSVSIIISLSMGAMADPFGGRGYLDRVIIPNSGLFLARVLVGLLLPSAMAVMAYRAAAIRATQSSTGILFPAMIIVFLGEMIGTYMVIGLCGLSV